MIDFFNVDITGTSDKMMIQRLKILCSTPKRTVPLNRDYGIDFSIIDKPINRAKPLYVAEVTRAIRKYEPSVNSVEVQFESQADGKLIPKVVISI